MKRELAVTILKEILGEYKGNDFRKDQEALEYAIKELERTAQEVPVQEQSMKVFELDGKIMMNELEILKVFLNCKAVVIIGLDECKDTKHEILKIIKKLNYKSDDVKYMGIDLDEEKRNRTYMYSKKLMSTVRRNNEEPFELIEIELIKE